ncbi:MAG: hydrogenase maturation nickel metallochaperone HypA [Gemmatimonadota bacterium]|nr:MAG: hydrogenase maturation nickel metallochaperone HypA [Gemmatimonadota bacterium]
MSVAVEVGRILESRVGLQQLQKVVAVGLEVGDQAGVEFESLEFCLEAVFGSPPFRNAGAEIERVPGNALRVAYLEVDDDRQDD